MTPSTILATASAIALATTSPARAGDEAPPPPRAKELRSTPSRAVGQANRLATIEPSVPSFMNATAVFAWNDGIVYHAYTTPGRVTDIILQPGEALGSVASGDTARWIIGDTTSGTGVAKRAHVLVKPFSAGLTTNLVITTDRRTYHVLLTSTAGNSMAALSWTYPTDDLIAVRNAEEARAAAAPAASGLNVDQLHFGYSITGDRPAWRPLRAFDDGRQTFIEFPANLGQSEAPPLFAIGVTGDAELINYRVRGRYYVVDRLIDTAELRLGAKKQIVVRIAREASAASGRGRK